MKHMGWTYWDLLNTPAFVVENIWRYMNTEAKHHNVEMERAKKR